MSSSLVSREFNGFVIQQRQTDGYINLNQMAKACSKRIDNWMRLKETHSLLKEFKQNPKYHGLEPVITIEGRHGGSWGHPDIVIQFAHWLKTSVSEQTEKIIQKQLHSEIGGTMEVPTSSGKIDILTSSELIEVKRVRDWIKGVGQVMIYGQHFLNHRKRLHLFGKTENSTKRMIELYCESLKIRVTWHDC